MAGLVFFATENHDAVVDFYVETVGASVWIEQPDCTILQYGNLRFGFCDRDHTDDCGILTFVSSDRAGVDELYERVGEAAVEEPHVNEKYEIYRFFAADPDGRTAEFQTFLGDDVGL